MFAFLYISICCLLLLFSCKTLRKSRRNCRSHDSHLSSKFKVMPRQGACTHLKTFGEALKPIKVKAGKGKWISSEEKITTVSIELCGYLRNYVHYAGNGFFLQIFYYSYS